MNKRIVFNEADLSEWDRSCPAGWAVASRAEYVDGKGMFGADLGYTHAVQLFNRTDTFNIVRGTGDSFEEALLDAISQVMVKN